MKNLQIPDSHHAKLKAQAALDGKTLPEIGAEIIELGLNAKEKDAKNAQKPGTTKRKQA